MQALKALIVVVLIASLAGCGPKKGEAQAAPKPGAFPTPVVAVKLSPTLVEEKVPVVGSLSANEAVEIKSEIDGTVSAIKFEEGQKVAKGDVLILIDPTKLAANLAQMTASLDIAQTTFNRMKTLVESGAVSKQEFDQAQSEVASKKAQVDLIKAQLEDATIVASLDGVVGERKVSVGQVIAKNTLLTYLIDDSIMKADFHVPERFISRLEVGQPVALSVAAYSNEEFKGEVYFVDPQVDENSRTVLVRARVPNTEGKLRRGMFAQLDLVIAQHEGGIVVPETALIPKGEQVFVFTIDAENKAQMNLVTTGVRMPGNVEILSGLKAGDTVITEGYQKIGPGSLVMVMPNNPPGANPTEKGQQHP